MIESILKTIPLLSNFDSNNIKLTRLAGLTNKNYLVTITTSPKQKYILRIPRESTNAFVNRKDESHNANIAEELGIAPKSLWRKTPGNSLTEYLENSITPNLNDSKTLEKITKTLATLHGSKTVFKGVLDNQKITKYLTQYFKLCSIEQQQSLKLDYQKALSLLELEPPLCKRPAVPSHIDLVLDNILLRGENIWFIDWEYSAMASPFWDIATLCNSAKFDSAQSEAFIKRVLKDYQENDLATLKQYLFITNTISHCWQIALAP